MIYRPIFVTNSSSCCTVVYGIEMDEQQLDEFLKILYRKDPKKANEFVKHKSRNQQEEIDFDPEESFVEAIKDDPWDAEMVLPKSITISYGEGYSYGEKSSYWVDFQARMDAVVEGEKVVLKDFSATEVSEIVEMAKEAGVRNTDLQLSYWQGLE